MIKKNFLLYGVFFSLIGLIIFLYYPAIKYEDSKSNNQQDNPLETTPVFINAAEEKIVELIRNDLSKLLGGVDLNLMTLLDFQKIDFNDASLGCKEPNKNYAQVITPGYKVILLFEEKEYDYRSDAQGNFKLCK